MSAHREQGREARLAGHGSNDCPFARGGPEWIQWMDGWNQVDFEYRVQAAREKTPEVAFEKAEAPVCQNCGQPGAHFVPPCLGEEGFYVCETLRRLDSAIGDDE